MKVKYLFTLTETQKKQWVNNFLLLKCTVFAKELENK